MLRLMFESCKDFDNQSRADPGSKKFLFVLVVEFIDKTDTLKERKRVAIQKWDPVDMEGKKINCLEHHNCLCFTLTYSSSFHAFIASRTNVREKN